MPLGLLGLLGVQFFLGMAVNLFVHLPPAGAGIAEMMGNGPLAGLHMMLGVILAAGAVLGVATALPNGQRATACAVGALGGILVALGGILVAVGGYLAEVVTVR